MFLLYQSLNTECKLKVSVHNMSLEVGLSSDIKCTDVPNELQMDIDYLGEYLQQLGNLTDNMNNQFGGVNISDYIGDIDISSILEITEMLQYYNITISGNFPGIYPSALMCAAFEKKSCLKGSGYSGLDTSNSIPINITIPLDFKFEGDSNPFAGSNQQVIMAASSMALGIVVVVLIIVLICVCCKKGSQKDSKQDKQDSQQERQGRDERILPQQSVPLGMYQPQGYQNGSMYNQPMGNIYNQPNKQPIFSNYQQPQFSQPQNSVHQSSKVNDSQK